MERGDPNRDGSWDDLVSLVRDALAHLHDVVHLQTHRLARRVVDPSGASSDTHRGRALRRLLLDAIASLEPSDGVGEAPGGRVFRVLHLRYVEDADPRSTQHTLGISRSQYFTDLRHAIEAVASVIGPRLSSGEGPVRQDPGTAGEVPLPLTSFIGREMEVAALDELLTASLGLQGARPPTIPSTSRLITITGAAGSGKTRLAVETASLLRGRLDLRVHFVDLAPLRDAALVLPILARCFEIPDGPPERLLAAISEQTRGLPCLVVLDTFEHVLDASSVLPRLLQLCPQVTVLVTSRTPLELTAEREFPLAPLAFPTERVPLGPEELSRLPAVQLFLDRARTVRPDLHITPVNAADIAEICRRLDGLPLAIELAAARSRILTPAEMRIRLDRTLTLLTRGARDLAPRHRTLRAAIEWSVDLLDECERVFLRRLAVFSGGWTLEAAEAVVACGAPVETGADELNALAPIPIDALDAIESLAAKGLIRDLTREGGAYGHRFTMLDTIRQFARELLERSGEAPTVRARHAAVLMDLAVRAERELRAAETRRVWLDRLEQDHDNFRAALSWFEDTLQAELGLRLTYALSFFWWPRGYVVEGNEWLNRFLALPAGGVRSETRAQALLAAGVFARHQRDSGRARRLLEESVALQRENETTADLAKTLHWLASATIDDGDFGRAQELMRESLAWALESGDSRDIVRAQSGLGDVARCMGEYQGAERLFEQALELVRKADHVPLLSTVLMNLGNAVLSLGRVAQAASLFRDVLKLVTRFHSKRDLAVCLASLARLACARKDFGTAALFHGAAENLLREIGGFLHNPELTEHEESVAAARAELGGDAYQAAYDRGAALKPDEALAFGVRFMGEDLAADLG